MMDMDQDMYKSSLMDRWMDGILLHMEEEAWSFHKSGPRTLPQIHGGNFPLKG